MLIRIALSPVWGLSCRYTFKTGLLPALVLFLAFLPGCEKSTPETTPKDALADIMASSQRAFAEFVSYADEVEKFAETRPVAKQAVEPLRAQEAIAQNCIDELNRRFDTLSDDMAVQTDPRTSGKPVHDAFIEDTIEMWVVFTTNTMSVEKFLRLARAEPGLADHEIESWTQRFEIQRKKLGTLAPSTEP